MTRSVDWYFDYVSPFAYLQFEALADGAAGVTLVPRPVLFAGLLGHWGHLGPAEIPAKRLQTYRYCQWLADRRGVPFRTPERHPFNPLALLRLTLSLDATPAVVRTVFRHVWGEGRDGEAAESLAMLAERLDIDDLADRIADPGAKRALRENTERAAARGVFGIPTVAIDDELFWGEDATGMLLDYLADPALFAGDAYARLDRLPTASVRAQSRLA